MCKKQASKASPFRVGLFAFPGVDMTKDGIREKVRSDLQRLYDRALHEEVPPEWLRLLDRLK